MLRAEIASQLREIKLELSLEVAPGTCLALVGPSGAGKSTTLRAIAGLHRPGRGRVRLGSSSWFDSEAGVDLPPERRSCGYLFQEYALFPHLSAWRNVAFGLTGRPREARHRLALELLTSFGVGDLADAAPARLSGGERQRVALARALARDPDVLLLDEPLAALDSRTSATAARELSTVLERTSAAAILVTHDFGEAALLADEVAVLDRGGIVQRGSAGELSARPASAFVADFTGAAVLFGSARPGPGGTTLVELDVGGVATSTDRAEGSVGLAIYPWEITIEPSGADLHGSALNRLEARVTSVTEIGNRARIGLVVPETGRAPQPTPKRQVQRWLAAEITGESARRLALAPGLAVVATWKATATRLVER